MNTPAEAYRETFTEFFLDRFKEATPFSTWCLVSFVIGLAVAVWIVWRRKGFTYRVALVPFSFVPFMISLLGFTWNSSRIFYRSGNGALSSSYFDPHGFIRFVGDVMFILPFGILLSIVLLVFSSILIFVTPFEERSL